MTKAKDERMSQEIVKLTENVDRARRNFERCDYDDPLRLHYMRILHTYTEELEGCRLARAEWERIKIIAQQPNELLDDLPMKVVEGDMS